MLDGSGGGSGATAAAAAGGGRGSSTPLWLFCWWVLVVVEVVFSPLLLLLLLLLLGELAGTRVGVLGDCTVHRKGGDALGEGWVHHDVSKFSKKSNCEKLELPSYEQTFCDTFRFVINPRHPNVLSIKLIPLENSVSFDPCPLL